MPLPFPLSDLAKETTSTEGTGSLFLDPSPPHRTLLAGVGAGVSAWFCIYQTETAWEVFEGQVTAGVGGGKDSVSRAGFIASSTGSTVNFGGGVKIVYNTVPAREVLARGRALQELADGGLAGTARTNLGLGTIAVEAVPLALAKGGTGATTAAAARTALGLLSAAIRAVGVGASDQIPDRGLADARYQAAPTAGRAYVDFPTDGSVKAPFYMSAAPTRWTRITTGVEGCTMRLVHSGGGTALPPSGTFQDVATAIAKGHALTVAELAAHTHVHYHDRDNTFGSGGAKTGVVSPTLPPADASNNTSSTGDGQAHVHAIDLAHASFLLASYTG